jgi:hypothetical protein
MAFQFSAHSLAHVCTRLSDDSFWHFELLPIQAGRLVAMLQLAIGDWQQPRWACRQGPSLTEAMIAT